MSQNNKLGNIYIASMNMRGKWAQRPLNSIMVNVTSAQAKKSVNRLTFSPMSGIDGGYKGFYCFENYWQSGKVYQDIPREKYINWWKNLETGKRRYPGSKDKKVLHAIFNDNIQLDYIPSRKQIYVPEYYNLIKNSDTLKNLIELRKQGKDIVICDFDGPRKKDGDVDCQLVTLNYLREQIHNTQFPFGHGYVVAASIMDIKPQDYC